MENKLKIALYRFGIVDPNLELYKRAFTHSSYSNEHPEEKDYDRLEFLGDSLLDMIIASLLFDKYPSANSGKLSKMRAVLVGGENLSDLSKRFGFDKLVRYSKGEECNTRFHKHINEDVFEAFIGAVYLDKGYYFVYDLVSHIFSSMIENADNMLINSDPKSKLQEVLMSNINYVIVSKDNLQTDDVKYSVEARLADVVLGKGEGHNLKEAEINAARDALRKRVDK